MKHPIFFPFYNIYSDIVKTSLGLKSNRTIESFFKEAGIPVVIIGTKKCVTCEELLNAAKDKKVFATYVAQSARSKMLDELE